MTEALGPAWLRGDPAAAALLPEPVGPAGFGPFEAPEPTDRAAAEAALRALNPNADLAMDGAVVTGQQLGLFGGPCLTLYKAWTAVAWARALSRSSGLRIRPIFWLQTEDHDFPEVAWCGDPNGARVSLPPDSGRVSVSERLVPQEITKNLEAFRKGVGPSPHEDGTMARLQGAWRPGCAWTGAFCELLRWAFAEDDLLLFDPRHPAARAAAAPIHARALFDASTLTQGLQSRAELIEAQGFRVQVPVRTETLSFVHVDGPAGPRFRLQWSGAERAMTPDGRTVPASTLRRWLEEDPGRFTSSALLRPLVQDHLLPTVAYVAGPGEAAYWAQLSPLYRAFGRAMPRVLPRARIRLLEPWACRLLERHGVQARDAEQGVDPLLDRMGLKASGAPPAEVAAELAKVRRELTASLRAKGEKLDVEGPLGALDRKLERSFERFLQKYETLRKRSDEDALQAARRLGASLSPGGVPQERFVAFAGFFARHGRDHVMARIADSWSPGRIEPVDVAL